MLIACKFEEIYPPEISDFVFITDNVNFSAPQCRSIDPKAWQILNLFEFLEPSFGGKLFPYA
jgi:hypothetical protein